MTETSPISRRSRIRDVYAHPLGRDIVDKILMQLGRSPKWVDNPLVGSIRLGALARIGRGVDEAFVETLITLLNQHPDRPIDDDSQPPSPAWWKDAVFYQLYPRSFQDSDGDGIGDLRGILSRLDHLQWLGVDAIWLCPVYDSPNDDNGYDIRDYRAIMAEFGTMADFEALLAAVHERGMRLIMDLVVNHTSDEHEWFQQALADPTSPYRDYYFLREGEQPPNNWTSFFSGPAWRHYPEQGLWALHLFSEKQLDLNWEHPPLRAEIVELVRWWLAKGVDGFRLDVINYISKPPGLPDGHPMIGELMQFTGVEHYFAGPRLHEHLRQLRAEAFEPFGAVSIGETPGVGVQLGKLLTGDYRGEVDMVFNFDHLETPGHVRFDDYLYDLNFLRDYYKRHQSAFGTRHWMSLFLENHDNPRFISKVNPDAVHQTAIGTLLATILLTLRGTPFLYQGQELGMVNERFISIEQLRDVESLNRYAALVYAGAEEPFAEVLAGTRDHARTPMPWDADGGFTTGTPWIAGSSPVNVAEARDDPDSVLSWYRSLIALRREHPALRTGDVRFGRDRPDRWTYRRSLDGQEWLIELNLGVRPRSFREPRGFTLVMASGPAQPGRLAPYEARIYRRT